MSRYNRCNECYNMKCVFVTGERTDFDSSECADFRPMTNADRIRAMSDEELAEWMASVTACIRCPVELSVCDSMYQDKNGECNKILLDWLKGEAKI